MSAEAVRWAWDASCPSHTAKLVLVNLAYRANGQPVCWPSFAAIARDCGLHRKNVPRYIRQLVEAGLIAVKHRAIKSAQANEYVLNLGCPHAEDRVSSQGGQGVITLRTQVSSQGGQGVSSQRYPKQEVRKEEDTSATQMPPATPAAPIADPTKEVFDRGVAMLGKNRRALLGKFCKEHGEVAVLEGLIRTEEANPVDPVSFFVACMTRAPPARNGHDKDSPVTTLYRGAYRAAQNVIERERRARGEGDRGAGDPPPVSLLDRC